MAKKAGRLYEPQLAPERKVLARNQEYLDSIKGTDRITRIGEQYYMSCHCGAVEVTSDTLSPSKFMHDHDHGKFVSPR